jgi:hypothetical protein
LIAFSGIHGKWRPRRGHGFLRSSRSNCDQAGTGLCDVGVPEKEEHHLHIGVPEKEEHHLHDGVPEKEEHHLHVRTSNAYLNLAPTTPSTVKASALDHIETFSLPLISKMNPEPQVQERHGPKPQTPSLGSRTTWTETARWKSTISAAFPTPYHSDFPNNGNKGVPDRCGFFRNAATAADLFV